MNSKNGDNANTVNSISGEDGLSSDGRHVRRTLDEFFYPGLRHTQARNAGQTVSKWTGKEEMDDENGRLQASPDSLVVMVDQLWIWVLEDGTLISCFPPIEFADPNFEDTLPSVIRDCEKCANPYDLTGLLVRCAIKNIFVEKNSQFADLIAIYRWATTNKVARHTKLLEAFGYRQSSRGSQSTPAEGTEELKIALQITDILDELNMLSLLLETETEVLTSLHEGMYQFRPVQPKSQPNGGVEFEITETTMGNIRVVQTRDTNAKFRVFDSTIGHLELSGKPDTMPGFEAIDGTVGGFIHEAEQTLRLERLNLDRLRADASQAHKMVVELLDLEQKAASLEEARSTTKQGQAIMLFTVVTIIFLPLSFITSFLGQNVAEITGDEKNPRSSEVWRIAGLVP
ncbi:hypothetical protein QQX98_002910 [Neonectria punicea]|uniref:Uncharacterized protein n=1 Tax=Neonectria punicea TaxID=979145 RepID=A0ABR1HGF4_9HYPO